MSCLGNYIRLNKIGQGAFGTAWLTESKIDNKKYVIKEIGLFKMHEKERLDAKKEVSLLSKMNHQNIVTYYNSFEENGCFHILMEYCDGGDLQKRIKTQNGMLFKEDQILDYFIQICLALKHIHDQKILHRDIKPQNVFLTKNDIVKLGDFGIAKVMDSTTALTKTTVGTPFYFSPEICEGSSYNNKSDIWSLGCVLYELCSLNYAFYGQDITILAMRIKKVCYKPVPTTYSQNLRGLIDNMFRRSPNERPNINNILRKPFILKRIEKFTPPENPMQIDVKKPQQKRPSTANVVSRVDSGLKKKTKFNSPYMSNQNKIVQEKRLQIKVFKPEELRQNNLVVQQHGLFNKLKVDAMNIDKENGWKNIMASDDYKVDNKERPMNVKPLIQCYAPSPVAIKQNINSPAYSHYYMELNRLKEQRKMMEKDEKQMVQHLMKPHGKVPNEVEGVYRKVDAERQSDDRQRNYEISNLHGKMGGYAGEQALIVQEYLERKRQAKISKCRDGSGMAMVLGNPNKFEKLPIPQESPRIEDEIAEKLNKIRQKNFEQRQRQVIDDQIKKYEFEANPVKEDFNPIEARKAMEELKQKLKQKTEELRQKLERKERYKENKPRNEEDINNVILFPKRPVEVIPPSIPVNCITPPDPSISILLEKINPKVSPSGDNIKLETSSSASQPSLSVILSQINEKPSRPSTACSSEQSEIRKLKDDILKRLNNKPNNLLNEVDVKHVEAPNRKSWVYDMDENKICENTNLDKTNYSVNDSDTMVDVSFLNEDETEKNRPKWNVDNEFISDTIVLKNIKMATDSQGSQCEGSTITLDEPSKSLDLPTVSEDADSSNTYVDNSRNLSAIIEESQEISVIELHEEIKEKLPTIEREEVWKENFKKEDVQKADDEVINEKETHHRDEKENVIIQIENNIDNVDLEDEDLSDSMETDRNDLLECYKNVLIRSSSNSNSSNSNDMEDLKTLMTKLLDEENKITNASSLQDLSHIEKIKRRRIKSDGEIHLNWDKEWSSESTEEFSSEDFGDEDLVDPENIFLKIEKTRVELEEKVGIDLLIDAIEFVRENQDLNGDQLAEKLKQMISDEASINDILHLVVLEEQYNHFE